MKALRRIAKKGLKTSGTLGKPVPVPSVTSTGATTRLTRRSCPRIAQEVMNFAKAL